MSSRAEDHKPFTMIAITLLALLALVHALRVAFSWPLVIDGLIVPVAASIPAAVIVAGLAFMVWRESRG